MIGKITSYHRLWFIAYGHSIFQIFLRLRCRNIEFKMWSGLIFRSRWWWVSAPWKVWSSKFDIFLISSADVIPMTLYRWRHHRSIHSYLSSFHTFQSHMWLTYILPICKFFFLFYKPWRHSIVLMTSSWRSWKDVRWFKSVLHHRLLNLSKAPKDVLFVLEAVSSEFLKLSYFLSNFSSTAQFT